MKNVTSVEVLLSGVRVADLIAIANLQAYEQEAPAGLYLAIPFFLRCSDKQPVWLLNRTDQRVTYLVGCCMPMQVPTMASMNTNPLEMLLPMASLHPQKSSQVSGCRSMTTP